MGISSRRPNPGRKDDPGRWVYHPLGCGARCNGFLAAPPFGVMTHYVKHSKPCVSEITSGELTCKWCANGEVPVLRGYTAIYTPEYLRRFVIIPEDCFESVEEIVPHSQVKMCRGNHVTDPVIIRADLWRTQPLPPSAERSRPVNLIPSLLRMWQIPALTDWHCRNPDPVTSATPVSPVSDIPPAVAERARMVPLPTPEQVDAKLDAVIARLKYKGESMRRCKPSANGVHPPTPND